MDEVERFGEDGAEPPTVNVERAEMSAG